MFVNKNKKNWHFSFTYFTKKWQKLYTKVTKKWQCGKKLGFLYSKRNNKMRSDWFVLVIYI